MYIFLFGRQFLSTTKVRKYLSCEIEIASVLAFTAAVYLTTAFFYSAPLPEDSDLQLMAVA